MPTYYQKCQRHAEHHRNAASHSTTPPWKIPFHQAVVWWMERELLALDPTPTEDPWTRMARTVEEAYPMEPFGKALIYYVEAATPNRRSP